MYILANLPFTSKSYCSILNFQAHLYNSWTQPKVPCFVNLFIDRNARRNRPVMKWQFLSNVFNQMHIYFCQAWFLQQTLEINKHILSTYPIGFWKEPVIYLKRRIRKSCSFLEKITGIFTKKTYSLFSVNSCVTGCACCLTNVTAVPIPRTTMPVSPSISKYCLYLLKIKCTYQSISSSKWAMQRQNTVFPWLVSPLE